MSTMDKERVRAWMERWSAVEAVQREERRNAPMELRRRQMNAIMETAIAHGLLVRASRRDVETVRQRWVTLKRRLHDGTG